jgi:hypothetical protein
MFDNVHKLFIGQAQKRNEIYFVFRGWIQIQKNTLYYWEKNRLKQSE